MDNLNIFSFDLIALIKGNFNCVFQCFGELGIDLDQLLDIQEDVGKLLSGEKPGHRHGSVELLQDDSEISTVLDLRLNDLGDDFLSLDPSCAASLAEGSLLATKNAQLVSRYAN